MSFFPIDQALRDLSWLLNAPPLVNPAHPRFSGRVVQFTHDQQIANRGWLNQQTQNPLALEQWLAKKPDKQLLRLGRYAEHLLEFYLREGPCFNFVAANLPIRVTEDARLTDAANAAKSDRTTVGEIDFLLTDKSVAQSTTVSWHWELAVKYFLCLDVPNPQPTDFVGPEAVEVFEYKLQKLFERQLNNKPPAPYNEVQWSNAALTRGWIFYPLNQLYRQVDWLSPTHLRGQWLALRQVEQLADDQFEILNRQRWLSPAQGHANCVLNRQQLKETIQSLWKQPNAYQRWPSAILVAVMQPMVSDVTPLVTRYEEKGRLFIVPDQWIGFELARRPA